MFPVDMHKNIWISVNEIVAHTFHLWMRRSVPIWCFTTRNSNKVCACAYNMHVDPVSRLKLHFMI